jgi:hypothetical protein
MHRQRPPTRAPAVPSAVLSPGSIPGDFVRRRPRNDTRAPPPATSATEKAKTTEPPPATPTIKKRAVRNHPNFTFGYNSCWAEILMGSKFLFSCFGHCSFFRFCLIIKKLTNLGSEEISYEYFVKSFVMNGLGSRFIGTMLMNDILI